MHIYKKIVLSTLILITSLLGCACGNNESSDINNTASTVLATEESTTQVCTTEITTVQKTTQKPTEKAAEKVEEKSAKNEDEVVLSNEYTTRYQEVNMVTYPPFVFNYPDNWSIAKEKCNQQEELITLDNGKGASVTFLHYSGKLEGGGSGVYMNKVKISKAASSQFVPGFVQATDHSSLGEFMVAKIKRLVYLICKLIVNILILMEMLCMLCFLLAKRA